MPSDLLVTQWLHQLRDIVTTPGRASGGSILAIVTLAAPHQQPPVNIQASLHTFYSRLQRSATQTGSAGKNTKESTTPSKLGIPLLSIAGGMLHLIITPILRHLYGVILPMPQAQHIPAAILQCYIVKYRIRHGSHTDDHQPLFNCDWVWCSVHQHLPIRLITQK